jgi:hypothetical protein
MHLGPDELLASRVTMKHLSPVVLVGLALASSALAADSFTTTLNQRELLSAAYPQAKGDIEGTGIGTDTIKIPKLDLPDVKWPWLPQASRQTTSDSTGTTVTITPISVAQLDDAHTCHSFARGSRH